MRVPRKLTAAATVLGLGAAVLAGVSPAAADTTPVVPVTDEAGLRAAFGDPTQTRIVLGADISLTCQPGTFGSLRRTSDNDLVVEGQGKTITQTCDETQIMVLFGEGALTIDSATLTGGGMPDDGDDPTGSDGGAIESDDDVTVTGSTFEGNRALGGAGGAIHAGGALIVSDSTFVGNAANFGGALSSFSTVSVMNSTFTANFARFTGGAISGDGISLVHATVVANQAFDGAVVAVFEGTLASFGSVISTPVGEGSNCSLAAGQDTESTGYNYATDATCGLNHDTDVEAAGDPQLGELADNGGPTQTLLPAEDSPLVDAIPEADCHADVATDQRGIERPQDDNCDIGAVEVEFVNAAPVVEDLAISADEARPASVVIAASDPNGDPLTYAVGTAPEHGMLTGGGPGFSYTSDIGFSGTDTFTVDVCDDNGACTPATVTVEVAAFVPPAVPTALTIDPDTASPGDEVSVSGSGYVPGEAVFLVLYSDPVLYGAANAADDGALTTTLTVRDDTEIGDHILVAHGSEQVLSGELTITDGDPGTEDPGTDEGTDDPGDESGDESGSDDGGSDAGESGADDPGSDDGAGESGTGDNGSGDDGSGDDGSGESGADGGSDDDGSTGDDGGDGNGGLPDTGADVPLMLATIGALLVLAGGAALLARRNSAGLSK